MKLPPHTARVQYLTESRAVIDGVEEGTEIALGDPEKEKKKVRSAYRKIGML